MPRWREVRLSDSQTGFVTKSYTEVIEAVPAARPEIAVHFLATGTGACAIVECPGTNASPMMVDCGSVGGSAHDLSAEAARGYVQAVLNDHPGVRPNVVISHPDRDHYNLFPDVLPEPVNELWLGGDPAGYTEGSFPQWLARQQAEGADVHDDQEIPAGFHNDQQPLDELSCGLASAFILTANTGSAPNARSLVLLIEHGDFSVIFSGDATGETEARAMANYDSAVNATVLTGSHHGADTEGSNGTSTASGAWPEATQPEIIVYQSGTRFGHPRCDVTDGYDAQTVSTVAHPFHCGTRNGRMPDVAREETTTEGKYATERNGTIVIRSDGESFVQVSCDRTPECDATFPL